MKERAQLGLRERRFGEKREIAATSGSCEPSALNAGPIAVSALRSITRDSAYARAGPAATNGRRSRELRPKVPF
jgi:hypothetical protein